MKGPPFAAMKKAVTPVGEKVGQQINADTLNPQRLSGNRAKTGIGLSAEILGAGNTKPDEQDDRQDQGGFGENLRHKGREEKVGHIRQPTTSQDRSAHVAKNALNDEKQQREDHESGEGFLQ